MYTCSTLYDTMQLPWLKCAYLPGIPEANIVRLSQYTPVPVYDLPQQQPCEQSLEILDHVIAGFSCKIGVKCMYYFEQANDRANDVHEPFRTEMHRTNVNFRICLCAQMYMHNNRTWSGGLCIQHYFKY